MHRLLSLILALFATSALAVDIPVRNPSSGGGVGIFGRTDGGDPCTTCVGYVAQQTRTPDANTAATGVWFDVTASPVVLTAGRWLITGLVTYYTQSTTFTDLEAGIGTASGTSATGILDGVTRASSPLAPTTSAGMTMTVPNLYVNVTTTTSYYLKGRAGFTGGNPTAAGRITAVRLP